MAIYEHPPPQGGETSRKWAGLAKVAQAEGKQFDYATWLHEARESRRSSSNGEVYKELAGRETKPDEIIYFKIFKSQVPVIEPALETAALMLSTVNPAATV
jgi:hypothetical protein